MAEHAGWARAASNRDRDHLAAAWVTGEGEDKEWLSETDLSRQLNAGQQNLFPESRIAAKNAISLACKSLLA